jgi:hypothetical protein
MAQKIKIRTTEWLTSVRALDTTERPLRSVERIKVSCSNCGQIGEVSVGNADFTLKTKGYGYCCHECKKKKISEAAKKRTGEKNPFYGKTHSEKTKKEISDAQKKRLENIPEEKRKEMAKNAMAAAYEKFGGNPMHNERVRAAHDIAVHTQAFIDKARQNGLSKDNSHLKTASINYWKSPAGVERKLLLSESYRQERNDPNGKYYQKRALALAEMWADSNRVEAALKKTMLTMMERYGVDNWQKSEEAKKFFINNPSIFTSRGETQMRNWIESLDLQTEKSRIGGYEIDILIPKLGIGIEYNGLYWHSDLYKETMYHLNKTTLAAERGIKLYHVFEHEWRDREEQVKSFLRSKFMKNTYIIGARQCRVEEIEHSTAKGFLDRYHIQGSPRSSIISLGIYDPNDRLVAVMSVGRGRFDKERFEVQRFCAADGVSVVGGLSRLSKKASNMTKSLLVSWCDRRWSSGSGYVSSGWLIDRIDGPDYFYTNGRGTKSRALYEEEEVSPEKEWFRVYDCGKIRFVYPYKP